MNKSEEFKDFWNDVDYVCEKQGLIDMLEHCINKLPSGSHSEDYNVKVMLFSMSELAARSLAAAFKSVDKLYDSDDAKGMKKTLKQFFKNTVCLNIDEEF